jgi:glycosyltransferase involved in cell wall biosynthesis
MPRIINIVTQMEAGGAQGAAIRLAREMRNKGIDAETWFLYKKFDTYINEPNIVIIHDSAPKGIIDVIQIIFKLCKLLRSNKPDGVITFTHYSNVLGQIASKLSGIKNRVATLRNPVWIYPKMVKHMDKLIGSIGVYTKIITVSSTVKDSCKSYPASYRKRLQLVYNGVPARVSKLSKQEAQNFFDLNYELLLINVGRLHHQKNQELIIKLMPSLPNYHLAIAGEGALKEDLINLSIDLKVDDRVHFLGEISPAHIPDFLKCGDVFVFPSKYEAFGFVIFEAAYNELPIVASNIPSSNEVLTGEDGQMAGLIVEDTSIDAWVQAIKKMENKDIRDKYNEEMKKKLHQFNFDNMVNAYIHYSEINK